MPKTTGSRKNNQFSVRHIRRSKNIPDNAIITCDETAIWYDVQLNGVADKGSKEVSVRSTGHTKNRPTVFLSAKGDGLNPYILLPRKRPLPELVKRFRGKGVFQRTNRMNQALTEDYLQNVIGPPMFTTQRLLVWDSFR